MINKVSTKLSNSDHKTQDPPKNQVKTPGAAAAAAAVIYTNEPPPLVLNGFDPKFQIAPANMDAPTVLTNEEGQKRTLKALSAHRVVGNIMIGVSCFCNLNMFAVRNRDSKNPLNLVILDISIRVQLLWKAVYIIISKSMDRQHAIIKIEEHLYKHRFELFNEDDPEWESSQIKQGFTQSQIQQINEIAIKERAKDIIREFRKEIKQGISFLSDDTRFGRVQNLFRFKRFRFHRVDLSDAKSTNALLTALKTKNLVLDTFYISNIAAVLDGDKREAFLSFIKNLRGLYPEALLVDAEIGNTAFVGLTQRVHGIILESQTTAAS